jgi:hypothetical protein
LPEPEVQQMRRPYSFRIWVAALNQWLTLTEGQSDIPSVLDAIWRGALERGDRVEVVRQ